MRNESKKKYLLMHTILDEIVFGGLVLETSSTEVMKVVEEISKYSRSLSLSRYLCSDFFLGCCQTKLNKATNRTN
ncbi:hypothetical protein G4B88_010931 [Cannabis sativa]|uniref:AP complex mu/sigma subunit domain-containing protein n=1 Tax=Cannabis sativa TaxID=3483 RepID=A0A7J6HJN2_CANSA|nr:hypothetical protein G4B88_010931 [Cannabis sativa]